MRRGIRVQVGDRVFGMFVGKDPIVGRVVKKYVSPINAKRKYVVIKVDTDQVYGVKETGETNILPAGEEAVLLNYEIFYKLESAR